MPQSGILVKQWKAMKVPSLMAGFISPLAGPGAWKTFDGKIDGAMNCIFEIGSAIGSKSAQIGGFTGSLQKEFERTSRPDTAGAGLRIGLYPGRSHGTGRQHGSGRHCAPQLEKTDRRGPSAGSNSSRHQVIYGHDPKETAMAAMFQWSDDGKPGSSFPQALAEAKIHCPRV